MAGGADVLLQAPLGNEGWVARADMLQRVDRPSALGAWSYEPFDTKLARETRGSAILRLCAYADFLTALQGERPARMCVVAPGRPFSHQSYRVDELFASVLQHVLGSSKTLPDDRGLFLAETWRLAPRVCGFTSELFYEGRLAPKPGLERQRIDGSEDPVGAGLWFLPVEHVGNQNCSFEEARAVGDLVRRLASGTYSWTDERGVARPLGYDDVLIVAPYNAQVSAIQERLPEARVGTVDRFQGQEAPVVIYSMATSSPEDAPRGMEFLYSLNRLNAATSRARCAVVLVASPKLFEPDCQTVRQMQLANAFAGIWSWLGRCASLWFCRATGQRSAFTESRTVEFP